MREYKQTDIYKHRKKPYSENKHISQKFTFKCKYLNIKFNLKQSY